MKPRIEPSATIEPQRLMRPVPEGARVVVVGDSWSAGYGATVPETQNWASVAADRLGWRLTKFALGGAGYTREGTYADYKGDYRYCLRKAREVYPESKDAVLVVIQGGINDTDLRLKPAPLTAAFEDTVRVARQLYPDAQVVALGPMAPTDPYEEAVGQVDGTLAEAAQDADVPYLDAYDLGWFDAERREGLVKVKIVHPSTGGYALIGKTFADYVRTTT